MALLGAELVEEARTWIGTPYAHYMRQKGREGGVDCLNFIAGVCYDRGVIGHIPTKVYDRKFWLKDSDLLMDGILEGLETLQAGYEADLIPTPSDYRPGDTLLLATIPGLLKPNHAVFVEEVGVQTFILHADMARKKVLRTVLPKAWRAILVVRVRRSA